MSEQIEYKEIHIRSLSDVPSKGAWLASLPNGAKRWFADGKLHRLDGPAVERDDGAKEWYVNGKLHRLDGPAVEWVDGTKEWYVNDNLHRLDGPAVERDDGRKYYWIDGKKYSEKDYWIEVNKIKGELERIGKEDKQEIEQLQKRIIKLQAHNDMLSRRLQNLAMMLLKEKIDND